MILSVSRRTDIPAFYSEWFMNRLQEGYVLIKNPMNANQISKVALNPYVVDCIVFWSKNPKPLIKSLDLIDRMGYKYYFQFTITPYDDLIEAALPDKNEILKTFISLSNKIGKEKVVWRYDPIIINNKFTVDFHLDSFSRMISILSSYTNECIISFVDPYKKAKNKMRDDLPADISEIDILKIAEGFSRISANSGISLKTCAEKIDLAKFGIDHASCIDKKIIEKTISGSLSGKIKKDGQRQECGCIECIDIGAYDTCNNGCIYCYATDHDKALSNYRIHDPNSPLLIGNATENDKVTERKVVSFRDPLRLF